MPRILAAGIHAGVWPSHRSTVQPLRMGIVYHDCAALSSASEELEQFGGRLLEGPSDGDLFRYDDVCTPCAMGAVVFSHTARSPGVLKTLALAPRYHPVCPRPRSIGEGGKKACEDHWFNPLPHRTAKVELKSCLKKLRGERLLLYGGRQNCGGRMGFTAKTLERRIVLRGDKTRLAKQLQQIDYQALGFVEILEGSTRAAPLPDRTNHRMAHPMDHHIDHPMDDHTDGAQDQLICSSSIKELLQDLILDAAFEDLPPSP
jgi:hypothetical protein